MIHSSAQRASSITTRIKTLWSLRIVINSSLREHLPLQQGLRQGTIFFSKLFAPHTQRASSITTRIKTVRKSGVYSISRLLREHLPLQQGLRQKNNKHCRESSYTQRASSITTRIKTCVAIAICLVLVLTQRASSITTRIKTLKINKTCDGFFCGLREHLPLQQGLKPNSNFSLIDFDVSLREHLPLQQGLRLICKL